MRVLENVNPKAVMRYFENICAIPHGSGNTDAISDYFIKEAEKLGLWAIKDEHNNVVIKKAASKGYENHPTVILQAHLDMVCEKEAGCNIDFLKDSISIKADGDFISACGTTLGGDDGIGVAMIMAVLEDDTLKHPSIEAVFTSDEETGMFGAAGLNPKLISGRRMINIDSEQEGVFTVSCAGGARAEIKIPFKREALSSPLYELNLCGLKGGHSGVEIDKGRYNSNVLMGKFLSSFCGDFRIADIFGGTKDNAIPAKTVCLVSTELDITSLAESFVSANKTAEEPNLKIDVRKITGRHTAFTPRDSRKIAEFLSSVKNGVQAFSQDIEGLVETSLNLGCLKTEGSEINAVFSVRSSVNTAKENLLEDLKKCALAFGGNITVGGHYPAWEYKKDSYLRDVMVEQYEALSGKKPIVEAIHAGLECGLFSEKLSGLDAVSFGPDMFDIHTPSERLSISSVVRSYAFLLKVLENL